MYLSNIVKTWNLWKCLFQKSNYWKFLIEDYHNVQVDFNRYDLLSSSKDPNRKLKEHQKEAVQFLLSRKKCILADDPGGGKSTELVACNIEGNFDSVLIIICPASIKTTLEKRINWYVPERKDINNYWKSN